MNIKDWFQNLMSKLGVGKQQKQLQEGTEIDPLDPKNEEFKENLLKELGFDKTMIKGFEDKILAEIEFAYREKYEKENIMSNLKTLEDVEKFIKEVEDGIIEKSEEEITIRSANKDNKNINLYNYTTDKMNNVYNRHIFAYSLGNAIERKQQINYNIDYCYCNYIGIKNEEAPPAQVTDEITEVYDCNQQLEQNSEQILNYLLKEKFPIEINEFNDSEKYNIEINGYTYGDNYQLDPTRISHYVLKENMLKKLGVPDELAENKYVREEIFNTNGYDLKTVEDVEKVMKELRECIQVSENGVKISRYSSLDENKLFPNESFVFGIDSETGVIYERKMQNTGSLLSTRYEVDFTLEDFKITEEFGKESIGKTEEQNICIYDFAKLPEDVEDKMKQMLDLDLSLEHKEDRAKEFRNALQQDYKEYVKQKELKEKFPIEINEELISNPEIAEALDSIVMPELEKLDIDLSNAKMAEITEELKTKLPIEIDENKITIYSGGDEARQYASLEDGKIQKSYLKAVETGDTNKEWRVVSTSNINSRDNANSLEDNIERA